MHLILLEIAISCILVLAKLYHYGDASSYLSLTGLSCQAFTLLIDALILDEQPHRTGRPQLMHPTTPLGLYLFYVGSIMGIKHLCFIFWTTYSTSIHTKNQMLFLVLPKLIRHPLARVKSPWEKMEDFAWQINQHQPKVDDVIGFMHGLALTTDCSSEPLR